MSEYPRYLTDYPNAASAFPFFMKKEQLRRTRTPPHRHDFLELSLFIEGAGMETVNGQRHPLLPGTMMFLLPYQIHELHYEAGVTPLMYTCNFDIGLLSGSLEADWGFQAWLRAQAEAAMPYVQLDECELRRMQALFSEMYTEYAGHELWRNYRLKAMLMEALVEFERCRRRKVRPMEERPALFAKPLPDRKSLWPVVQYIHANYRETLTLKGLARQFHFNVSHLSELFKRELGCNFVHFLQEIRVRHAGSLLLSTDLPVSAISLEVGFGSLQTFSRLFRQHKGCTPMEYRR